MNTTADSNLTKRALAAAMKELMEQMPFSKISVSNIAEQCGMNRKSFYYHFKDKYDLVNWIFDMEYLQLSSRQDYAGIWDFLTELCSFFYENRSFYSGTDNITVIKRNPQCLCHLCSDGMSTCTADCDYFIHSKYLPYIFQHSLPTV